MHTWMTNSIHDAQITAWRSLLSVDGYTPAAAMAATDGFGSPPCPNHKLRADCKALQHTKHRMFRFSYKTHVGTPQLLRRAGRVGGGPCPVGRCTPPAAVPVKHLISACTSGCNSFRRRSGIFMAYIRKFQEYQQPWLFLGP